VQILGITCAAHPKADIRRGAKAGICLGSSIDVDPEEAEMQRRRRTGMKGRRTRRPKARKTPTAPVSITILKEQVAALTHELKEAREQRTATAEVLTRHFQFVGRAQSRMLGKATQICGASFGTLLLYCVRGQRIPACRSP
jgi:hypothetical protein